MPERVYKDYYQYESPLQDSDLALVGYGHRHNLYTKRGIDFCIRNQLIRAESVVVLLLF